MTGVRKAGPRHNNVKSEPFLAIVGREHLGRLDHERGLSAPEGRMFPVPLLSPRICCMALVGNAVEALFLRWQFHRFARGDLRGQCKEVLQNSINEIASVQQIFSTDAIKIMSPIVPNYPNFVRPVSDCLR